MRRLNRALPALLFAGICNLVFADTNLLQNGDFSNANQISGWTLVIDANTGTLSWNSDDADGNSGSGSIELDTDTDGELTTANSACFRVPAGGAASISAQARVLTGIPGVMDFDFSFGCTIYVTPDCSGGGAMLSIGDLPQMTAWTSPATASGTLPANAQSANCQIQELNAFEAAPASVIFDNLVFTADYIFTDGFE